MSVVERPSWWQPFRVRRFRADCPHRAYATFAVVWDVAGTYKSWTCGRCGAAWTDSHIEQVADG